MRDFGQRQSEESDLSESGQFFLGKLSFFGKRNKERAARLERLKNFGPDNMGTNRTDCVLQARELIITESVADHQSLNDLRDQIGSWKNDEGTEPRILASEIAVDEVDIDLLDRLRSDIASFKETKMSEEKLIRSDDDEVLSGLRGDLSGLFGNSPAMVCESANETDNHVDDFQGEEPYLKDEQVSIEAIVEIEPDCQTSISQSDTPKLKEEQSFKVSDFRTKRREFAVELPKDNVAPKSKETQPLGIEQGEVLNLLSELQGQISALKEGQERASNEDVNEVRALLLELKEDVSALKEEKKQPSIPENSEIIDLFSGLKADISNLRKDLDNTKPPAESEAVELLAELKTEICEFKAEQAKNSMTSDNAFLELFVELQGEFSDLKKLHVESVNKYAHAEVNEIHPLLRSLKDDIESLKDEQMKSVELAFRSQFQDIQGVLKEMKSDVVDLNDEQVKMRDLLIDPAAKQNPSSGRINDLLSQLRNEIDTARDELGGESDMSAPSAGLAEIETLSTVNSVLTLLIGDKDAIQDEQPSEFEKLEDNSDANVAG